MGDRCVRQSRSSPLLHSQFSRGIHVPSGFHGLFFLFVFFLEVGSLPWKLFLMIAENRWGRIPERYEDGLGGTNEFPGPKNIQNDSQKAGCGVCSNLRAWMEVFSSTHTT